MPASLALGPDHQRVRALGRPRHESRVLARALGVGDAARHAVDGLLREGALSDRTAAELRAAGRRHGLAPSQVSRLVAICELSRRWHVPRDSAAPAVTSPRQALLLFQDLRRSDRERFAVLYQHPQSARWL